MLINLRNALMSGKRLPYDAEVEYLESTGTQWIDTGVIPNGVKSTIDFALTQVKAGQIAGCHNPNNQRYYVLEVSGTPLRFKRVDRFDNGSFVGTADTNRHTSIYYYDGNKASFDGTESQSGQYAISSAIYNCILFGITVGGVISTDNAIPMKVFGCKMEKDGVVLRDFIPVRKGTVGYLYDRVSGKLFGNAGTGDFVLGPDVVPVEFLESDGGQYIQTDFTPDDSYGFEVECFTPAASSSYNSRAIGLQNGQVRWLYCTERGVSSNSFFGWNEAVSVGIQSNSRIMARCNWLNNRTISIGDTVYKSNLATLGSTGGLKAALFGINYNGSVFTGQLFVGMMYSAKVSIGSAIGYNYIPVRVGTEGAMMDVLTRRIYRNAGTGAFTYGNDLKYPIPAE